MHSLKRYIGVFACALASGAEMPIALAQYADTNTAIGEKVFVTGSNIPTIVCIQVVPHFEGVEITTSPGRNVNRSHRALSDMTPRYRRTGAWYPVPT